MINELINQAHIAKQKAIPKYSNFHVGAALITADEKIYHGANIESSSYGLTICAERTALFQALLEGKRNFKAIAVVSDADDFCPPCGACRQVLSDYCSPDLDVILSNKNETKVLKLKELLPFSFNEGYLK